MQVLTIKDSPILKPNKDHKNFVETGEVIAIGTPLEGNERYISGLRRGEAFTYKVFITNDNKIIYLNNIKPMTNVEVSLGVDGNKDTTKKEPINHFKNITTQDLVGISIGGTIGYMYCKSKNCDMATKIVYVGMLAIAGYGISLLIKINKQ